LAIRNIQLLALAHTAYPYNQQPSARRFAPRLIPHPNPFAIRFAHRSPQDFGTNGWFFRAAFYIVFHCIWQFGWVANGSSVTLAILLGLSQAFIGLNVQHDANHGASSKKPWVNEVLGFGADFIGGSKYSWIEQVR